MDCNNNNQRNSIDHTICFISLAVVTCAMFCMFTKIYECDTAVEIAKITTNSK